MHRVVAWYLNHAEQRTLGSLPFYCRADRVGAFAVAAKDLAMGGDAALFQLFITLSMYQALRDVTIMRHQRSLPTVLVRQVACAAQLERSIAGHGCEVLRSADEFDRSCNVVKQGKLVDCGRNAGVPCHVKDATRVLNRMGDMGKLPTSAWLRHWTGGGMASLLDEVRRQEPSPEKRAVLLVSRFTQVFRVGRKLSTMFVSSLSTPALAPGLTPWFPVVDGNYLVVVDTNVARAADLLRASGVERNYEARVRWVRQQAERIDLRDFDAGLPRFSPRIVQEALYAFCSKSNRVASRDACAERSAPCTACPSPICPFWKDRSQA